MLAIISNLLFIGLKDLSHFHTMFIEGIFLPGIKAVKAFGNQRGFK